MKWLIGLFAKVLASVIAALPRAIRDGLGNFIGWLWFDLFRIRRRVAVENVGIAFPEKSFAEQEQIARMSLRHMGRTLVEYCLFPFFGKGDVNKHFVFEGLEHIDAALKGGQGAIFLGLHLGNGDFAIAALSRLGYPMNLISKEFKSKWLNELWFGMRRKHGTRFIPPEKSSFEILRSLRRNEIVVFVLDQYMGPPIGVRTKFFGRETGTAMGLALMAGRTRAPVIPCYTYRRADGKHVAAFEAPIPFLDNGPDGPNPEKNLRDASIAVMTQIYTDKIEAIVRAHPEQWMWIHRRWKEFRD